jgi:hypothetical protein
MDEDSSYFQAKKEMVRVEHLIFVSLKYSRTVDVIKSVVKRLISTFDLAITAALEAKLKPNELKAALHGPKTMRDTMVREYPEAKKFMDFYRFLRELDKANVKSRLNEFRRHVTLVADVDQKEQNVKIETVEEYYEKAQEFLELTKSLIEKEKK